MERVILEDDLDAAAMAMAWMIIALACLAVIVGVVCFIWWAI